MIVSTRRARLSPHFTAFFSWPCGFSLTAPFLVKMLQVLIRKSAACFDPGESAITVRRSWPDHDLTLIRSSYGSKHRALGLALWAGGLVATEALRHGGSASKFPWMTWVTPSSTFWFIAVSLCLCVSQQFLSHGGAEARKTRWNGLR